MNQNTQDSNTIADTTSRGDGFCARLVLSYGEKSRVLPRSIQVLDVGCSRGSEALISAGTQPDVEFLGIDCNETALEEARQEAAARGLNNITFQKVAFDSLACVDIPEGGYDVIRINDNPAQGMDFQSLLAALRPMLAEHGLVTANLRGGRAHYALISEAINGAIERNAPLRERLEAARDQVDHMVQAEPNNADWRRASLVDDAEFVDSYMQSGEVHLDVSAIWQAIEASDMRFIRWQDTSSWDFESLGLTKADLERVRSLPMGEQFRLVEEQRNPERLNFTISHKSNAPRTRFDLTKAGETHFMVHPDTTFGVTTKNYWGSTHMDGLTVQRGSEEPVSVRPSPALTALFALRDQREPFSGLNLVEVMTGDGASLEEALMALHQLMGLELVYAPHEFDVAQFYSAMIAERTIAAEQHNDVVVTPSPALAHDLLTPAGDQAVPSPLPKAETKVDRAQMDSVQRESN
ncbi:MAG: hypothetical protein ACI9D0_000961 [Bacteroidia bacterium]|jgi:hypothetical protein